MKEEGENGTEKKTKYVKAYENFQSSMRGKGPAKQKVKLGMDEDESLCEPKVSEEGRVNTIHFSKNLKQIQKSKKKFANLNIRQPTVQINLLEDDFSTPMVNTLKVSSEKHLLSAANKKFVNIRSKFPSRVTFLILDPEDCRSQNA